MLGLYLLAAHLVGDFVLQTRWQADGKLADPWIRLRHVVTYCLPFVPVVAYAEPAWWRAYLFGALLCVLHYATDSRRFHSTLGDVVAWRLMRERNIAGTLKKPGGPEQPIYARRPPNPWPAAPLMIDQTLHVCQLALLGGLFLT